jgi:hypothetical protein
MQWTEKEAHTCISSQTEGGGEKVQMTSTIVAVQEVQQKQTAMQAIKEVLTDAASRVNAAKADIDRLTAELQAWETAQKHREEADPDIVDGEQYRLLEVWSSPVHPYVRGDLYLFAKKERKPPCFLRTMGFGMG